MEFRKIIAHVVGSNGQDYVVSVTYREHSFGNAKVYDAEVSRVMPLVEGESPDFNEGADAIETVHRTVNATSHQEALDIALFLVP